MTTTTDQTSISSISIENEMEKSYLDYAMSVIVSRAIPDARDGLKPVHRRILYAMKESGYEWNRAYKKSARVVGDVMGKYHPHGDNAIYDALVRMAQDFSMSFVLLDGQGNFGSMDGDKPAAMRYTEVRLGRSSSETLLQDIEKKTVDFQDNYDGSDREPVVLPARYPNLLVNGAGGIAVGMATNIPPHNLGEVIDACLAYIENNDITIAELMQHMPGPDFPTGGIILGRAGIHGAYNVGRGSVVIRSKTHFEDIKNDRQAIIVTETPYQVNKSRLVERIAEVVRDKLVEGISDLRDESDRDGVRIVIELKKDTYPEIVLNQLFRHTPLQTSFGCNMLALNNGRPQQMNLLQFIQAFVNFREEVITKRTLFELNKSRARGHVLAGLGVAVANIDDMIALIRSAPDANTARDGLMETAWPAKDVEPLIKLIDNNPKNLEGGKYKLTEVQARAILDMKLQRLTGLERDKIADELKEVCAQVADYLDVLNDKSRLFGIMVDELKEIRENFAVPRRTSIEESEFEHDIEDLIQPEDMVVTVSHNGYIKRVPLSTYRAQRRGGKGRSGMSTREEDFVDQIFVANTHDPILFFSSRGIVHQMKVYRLPEGSPTSKGRALVNLLPLKEGETISTIMPMPEDEETWDELSMVFVTSKGNVRRNKMSDFTNIRANGKIAMKFDEESDEKLVAVRPCDETQAVFLATHQGKCIRFPVTAVREFQSRASTGVRGIKLAEGDEVVSASVIYNGGNDAEKRENYLKWKRSFDEDGNPTVESPLSEEDLKDMQEKEEFILTLTDKGFGKRSSAYEYRTTNRGGTGITNISLSDKNGLVVRSSPIEDNDQVMLVTDAGKLIRCPVSGIRIAGRSTQGVTVFKVADTEKVVSVARIADMDEDEDETLEGSEGESTENAIKIETVEAEGEA